jgi:hypothetical protein
MTKFLTAAALTAGLLTGAAGLLFAQDKAPASGIAGTWNLSLIGDHVVPIGLVIEQDGTKVTGTMMLMGTDVPVEGEFVDGALTLSANAAVLGGPGHTAESAHAADPASGPGPNPLPTTLSLSAKMQDDGTLAGAFATPRGAMKLTGERFRERKAPKPGARASASASASAAQGIAGSWNMAIKMEQGALQAALVLKLDGSSVSGTLSSDHSGTLTLEGTFTGAALSFSTTSLDSMHLEYTATLKGDGTLAGELSGPNVPRMAWTAERSTSAERAKK